MLICDRSAHRGEIHQITSRSGGSLRLFASTACVVQVSLCPGCSDELVRLVRTYVGLDDEKGQVRF